ncbi:Bcr/CflA family multidrug efflux MFS transporter [Aliivibrio finisterrensis]|uniref:Bcr/CflA family multidrug efflux MFS transporter n=1 Tax=Aliivibrio finisterrensis TaxID=511998 RepID=UPI0010213B69|nr:Bcr/CflA family multidrug efflux MFS transporter [Aliivibrio finisterrensis]RYU71173.1 Bcr/CflA family multidrug efflux MFS transporter [Aliivibrio finisterrensis]RYU74902.1 Bcr/CflA family multidrug efflux MFS transporter [Aliivibrio finisterrensis]RYU77347.1 Bcr/CflA family multidrug efflux MFS transporter [Aliivibrio finisterrensis]
MSTSSSASPEVPTLNLLLIVILGAIAALTPLAIDMYLPAMPSIAADLGVSAGSVQMTLTAYTAGFAIAQLIHGPLADSYGRRPVLIIGTILFAVCAVIGALVDSIESLMYIRVLQGVAGAASSVVIQAIVRDMFDKEDFARTMAFITLVMTVAPLAAPMIGGHLAVWFGWRSIFWLLAVFSVLIIFAILWKIPETLKEENREPFKLRSSLRNYLSLFKNPVSLGLIFSGAFSFSCMFAFLTAGSFVYIDIYGVSVQNFGYLFGLNIVFLIIMTTLNGRIVKRAGSHNMLKLGLSIQLFAGILMMIGQWLGWGLWGTVIPVVLSVGCISTIGSNSMALLLSHYPKMAGTASSLAGTLRFGTGSLVGVGIAMLPSDSAWPMVGAMTACSILSFGCYFVFGRKA